MKVLGGLNHSDKIQGHIHFKNANTTEDVLVVKKEDFKTVEPRKSLLNLEEILRHDPRSTVDFLRDLPPAEHDLELEGKTSF